MSIRTRRQQPMARFSSRKRRQARRQNITLKTYRQKRVKVYRRRINPIIEYPRRDEFMRRFRLSPELVKSLAEDFGQSLFCSTRGSTCGGGISHQERVCLALRYLATGANLAVIADTQGVCRSTVSRAVNEFVSFLYARRKAYVSYPAGQDLHETAIRFGRRHNFDKVVGLVDGTYLPIVKPARNEGVYVCRHGYHALNCLVVTDDRQRFLFVDASCAGSHHDMSVWMLSDFGTKVTHTDRLGQYFLLGDGGYGSNKHMLVPFKGQELDHLTPAQRRYQTRQTATRSSVERAIGQLKTRWRCLSKYGSGVVKRDPLRAGWLFHACCVLHNMCLDWGIGDLAPANNWDPQIELQIRVEAARRQTEAQEEVLPEQVRSARRQASARIPHNSDYRAGVERRDEIIHTMFGGPDPRAGEKARSREYKRLSRSRQHTS